MKAPTSGNFRVLSRAYEIAGEFGESFVVFVGGLAEYATFDVVNAQDEARDQSKRHGRERVQIKRIKV